MNLKNKFDFKSIKFRVWTYFISFALIMILLIWGLQIFFLSAYYEEMKITETTKIADEIIDQYSENQDFFEIQESISNMSQTSDIYVKVETLDGQIVITPNSRIHGPMYMYRDEMNALRSQLSSSSMGKVSTIIPSKDNTRLLAYACYLNEANSGTVKKDSNANEGTASNETYVLYIFSPLYPIASTVSILRTQLGYITFIAVLLSLLLAFYLANKISKPIKKITKSAAEMGKGNYSVQFAGGHYSEITELADTLTQASNELEKTDMYQKDLIANVSHDLRTPLTMIKSYAEMIRDLSGDNPVKREAHLHVIIEEADRLNVLVTDMLNMSRMQSKEIVIEKKTFDLNDAVTTLLTSYEILSEKEGYKFIFKGIGPVFVTADEAKIKQVMNNLINNAVKYCGSDKQIIIRLKKIGKKIRCEVKDHGAGIAEDEINHVWERYYKSSTHHVRPTEGSGLGLSIVKEVLNLHKANFGVNSKPGNGSTFWFELNISKTK